jgi:hypothetical protein
MCLPVRHCLALAAVVLTALAAGATAVPGDSAPRAEGDPAPTSDQWGWE